VDSQQPHLSTPSGPPPEQQAAGPSGVAAVAPFVGLFLLAIAIVLLALGLLGGWWGFGIAVALMIVGVLVLSRFVQRIAWTRKSPARLRQGLSGMNEDLSVTDDAHEEISAHDLPLDNPAHRELAEHPQRPDERQDGKRRLQPR